MGMYEIRAADMAQLSTTALAAILTGVGVVILVLLISLVILLVRAVRTHKRLLADLEERGVVIAQLQQRSSKHESILKPRAVLRRNTILPFNTKSGWGTLPSVETINPLEPPSIPPHYVPPKPAGFVNKSSRLSWPFSARRASGKAIQLRKIRVPILSTVIESPKPSPLVPVLSGSLGGGPPSPKKSENRPSSDQSLLQHHPAFRNPWQERETGKNFPYTDHLRRSLTAKPFPKTEVRVRPSRSRSVAEIPVSFKAGTVSRLPRPKLHTRSASVCSQSSGNAPDTPVPPLPLEIARIKTQERRRSMLTRSPSRFSVSSFESAGSSILATQSSPILPRSSNVRVQKVTKRVWRSSMIAGPRPIRDTLTLHGKDQRSQSSIKSSTARFSLETPSTTRQPHTESRSSTITNSSSMQSIKVKTAESVTLSKVTSPTCSPLTVRSYTPKRKSGSQVTVYGSPEERPKTSSAICTNSGIPKRQLSQASTQASSTRSSNGNPFQWDPTPLSSGKPSALKGSPSARKGHKRQNCVRISLAAPTILGPPSRSPSPSAMNDIQEESPNIMPEKRSGTGIEFSSTRSLPTPPSTSIFAPDLKMPTTSIRASLTPSSPTLSMADYNHRLIGSSLLQAPPEGTVHETKRMSIGSIFSIPTFPSSCHAIGSVDSIASPPPKFALSRPSNEYKDDYRATDSSTGPSSPFEELLPDFRSSPERPLLADEYDPERPGLVYQTPVGSPTARRFSSRISTIPEESSITSYRTMNYEQLRNDDSPPCSPKTLRPNSHLQIQNTFPQYSIQYSTIVEESPLDTIDPTMPSNDAFNTLNTGFDTNTSITKTASSSRNGIPMPLCPGSAKSLFEPLLDAAFPSSPPTLPNNDRRSSVDPNTSLEPPPLSVQSSPSSIYSSPSPSSSPSPLPLPPCSPRPHHVEIPTPSLNFTAIPTLSPSPSGPRKSPPKPLRSSIAKLRRMNSDAEKGGKERAGRGERRYLRLGREDSIALPGEESFLDELDDDETLDEEKGKRLVGNLLDWEEEATILELQEENEKRTDAITPKTKTPEKKDAEMTPPERSSSVWEDGENFWHSTPPHPPNSPNKPPNRYIPLSSSPITTTPKTKTSQNSTPAQIRSSKKREFEVARDGQAENLSQSGNQLGNETRTRKLAGNRYRKRSILGIGTPNVSSVQIRVQPPSGGTGTPGSLYDAEGFLRV